METPFLTSKPSGGRRVAAVFGVMAFVFVGLVAIKMVGEQKKAAMSETALGDQADMACDDTVEGFVKYGEAPTGFLKSCLSDKPIVDIDERCASEVCTMHDRGQCCKVAPMPCNDTSEGFVDMASASTAVDDQIMCSRDAPIVREGAYCASKPCTVHDRSNCCTTPQTAAPTVGPTACHPLDGQMFKMYAEGYVSSYPSTFNSGGQWISFNNDGSWIIPRYGESDAAPFLFKGVPGYCNQYKLQNRYILIDGKSTDQYWVSYRSCGNQCLRAVYSEESALPILFEDLGDGNFVLKAAWPGANDGYLAYTDTSSRDCGEYMPAHTVCNTVRMHYGRPSAMVVTLKPWSQS